MRTAVSILVGLACLTGTNLRAREPASALDEEATIRALEEADRLAVLHHDYAASERIWAADLLVNTPANRLAPDVKSVLRMKRSGQADYSSFDRRIEQVRIDGDLAIVMGGETVTPVGDGPLAGQTVQRHFTNVWKKRQGLWHLAARHVSNICSDGRSGPTRG